MRFVGNQMAVAIFVFLSIQATQAGAAQYAMHQEKTYESFQCPSMHPELARMLSELNTLKGLIENETGDAKGSRTR